jgi:hypothetical protein
MTTLASAAQMPTHIPVDREPVGFLDSAENIFLFLVLPVIIGGLYFLWRRNTRNKNS